MQKAPKPSLTGQRIKTRKRDEKEKYDPASFRDTIVSGIKKTVDEDHQINLEKASSFLTKQGSISDYRRYAEAFFDILFTGGLLESGGHVNFAEAGSEMDIPEAPYCVFRTDIENGIELMQKLIDKLFGRVIQQFKYLEKSLDEEMKKMFQFSHQYTEEQLDRLAVATYILIRAEICTAACLSSILLEHLVANGTSLSFTKKFFLTWLQNKDVASLISTLKKAEIDTKLLELWPLSKRGLPAFQDYFSGAELQPIVDFQLKQVAFKATKDLKAKLKKRMQGNGSDGDEKTQKEIEEAHALNITEIIALCKKSTLPNKGILEILWSTMMKSVEWNKKEDLLAGQAFGHIRKHADTLKAFTQGDDDKANKVNQAKMLELAQDFCFDNISFMKIFFKIITLLYQADVLDEEAITTWHTEGKADQLQSKKGLTVFLGQMDKFVAWLKSAEEESSEDEEEEESTGAVDGIAEVKVEINGVADAKEDSNGVADVNEEINGAVEGKEESNKHVADEAGEAEK